MVSDKVTLTITAAFEKKLNPTGMVLG